MSESINPFSASAPLAPCPDAHADVQTGFAAALQREAARLRAAHPPLPEPIRRVRRAATRARQLAHGVTYALAP
jgi:hypothetical protein